MRLCKAENRSTYPGKLEAVDSSLHFVVNCDDRFPASSPDDEVKNDEKRGSLNDWTGD